MLHLQSPLQDVWLLIKAASLKLDAGFSALTQGLQAALQIGESLSLGTATVYITLENRPGQSGFGNFLCLLCCFDFLCLTEPPSRKECSN